MPLRPRPNVANHTNPTMLLGQMGKLKLGQKRAYKVGPNDETKKIITENNICERQKCLIIEI